jgi:hypothetical protein
MALLLVLVASTAHAAGSRGFLERPLADEDVLQLSIECADAILVASVERLNGPVVILKPLRVVLSENSKEFPSLFPAIIQDPARDSLEAHILDGRPFPIFLRHTAMRPQPVRTADGTFVSPEWSVMSGGGASPTGGRFIPGKADEIAERLDRAIERSVPESLAMRSDLIVRGQSLNRVVVWNQSRAQLCRKIAIERVLFGSESADTILAYSPLLNFEVEGDGVFFLRAIPDRPYELIDLGAGAKMIHEQRAGRHRDLADVLSRIARAESNRPRPEVQR